MSAISGNSGNVTGPTGLIGVLNTWSATITRAVSDVTSFTNSGRNRLLGVYDMTGSAGGIISKGSNFVSTNQPAVQTAVTGTTITLFADNTVGSINSIAANVVFESVALGSSKTGDATLTFNFSLANTAVGTNSPFTFSWA
jgi:hypothetical protein